jgi:hypothetical protein
MTGESMRLASCANHDGNVEVSFLHHTIELTPTQARMFVRELATSLADAEDRAKNRIEVLA